jgi:hypothetical protein
LLRERFGAALAVPAFFLAAAFGFFVSGACLGKMNVSANMTIPL